MSDEEYVETSVMVTLTCLECSKEIEKCDRCGKSFNPQEEMHCNSIIEYHECKKCFDKVNQ